MAADLELLSAGWVERYREATADLPARPGTTARIEQLVTGGPGGDLGWWATIVDGRTVAAGRYDRADDAVAAVAAAADARGEPARPGDPPLVTLTLPWSLAVAIAAGEVEPAAAFMQGRAKVAGDHAALLRVLALTATPEYRVSARAVADATRR